MGLDGGTIISRSDVLRGSSWRVASQTSQHRSTRGGQLSSDFVAARPSASGDDTAACWAVCSLTGLPLREPVMACELGKLYNKESVLEFLLARSKIFLDNTAKWRHMNREQWEESFSHIRNLKDVFEVQFGTASKRANDEKGEVQDKDPELRWICPLTGSSFSSRLSALKTCGHLLHTHTLQQVTDKRCPLCECDFSDDDIIFLNGTEDEKQILINRNLKRRKSKQKKISHGSKRPRIELASSSSTG